MTEDPVAQRESARDRGRTLLEDAPWAEIADRAALLLTDPPSGLEDAPPVEPGYWLIVEREVARSLPGDVGQALYRGDAIVRHLGAPDARFDVTTLEGAKRFLEGLSRGALEARWRIRHAEPIVDRLRLQERLASEAVQLPPDAPERVIRTLWLEAHRGLLDLAGTTGAPSIVTAGETRGALERIACFFEEGSYPPARYLAAAAAGTGLGRRLIHWLDWLSSAAGGDEAAQRRSSGSIDQVREEVRTIVRQHTGTHDWLSDPDAYQLRGR